MEVAYPSLIRVGKSWAATEVNLINSICKTVLGPCNNNGVQKQEDECLEVLYDGVSKTAG